MAAGCAGLTGRVITADKLGLASGAARVESAQLVKASTLVVAAQGPFPAARITPAQPDFCKVLGSIAPIDPQAPAIQFQVNLPTAWNGRSVQYGGGGFNGVLITGLGLLPAQPFDQPSPLAQGYVTVGTDSGHQNQPGRPPQEFALNDEALLNFAHASYKKVRDVSVELMKQAYGRSHDKLYFMGSSEGGREGLTMAQRYPTAFNGIFSRVPVINWTGLQHVGLRDGLATRGTGWIKPAQVQLVHEAVLKTCDALDGLADGVVGDLVACKQKLDVASLSCSASNQPNCLNPEQVQAIKTLHSPLNFEFPLANGVTQYPGRGPSAEGLPASGPAGGWAAWWLGRTVPSLPPEPSNAIAWFYGAGAIQYFYARNPQVDLRSYKPQDYRQRVSSVSELMDATNPDLQAFHQAGGKLIMLENMGDYAQSPYAGIAYFESVQKRLGADRVAQFAKLYTAPGVDHVGTGAPANVNMLAALSNWVERGQAPAGLQLTEQEGTAPFNTVRARPLCEWPAVARYQGGDANRAASFACR